MDHARTEITTPEPAPASETAVILSMIERAARDPSVDVDKLERLMTMREQMVAKEAEKAFNASMQAAQAAMRPISANAANPQTRSRYATYDQLDRSLRPIYTSCGFSLSFDEGTSPTPDHIRVLCYVSHEGGHTRTYRKDMPSDGKGAKGGDVMTKTHAAGAAASYGARYLLRGIFNVSIGEDDRDGNTGEEVSISDEQVRELHDLLRSTGSSEPRFLAHFKVGDLADLPAKRFAEARRALKAREARS